MLPPPVKEAIDRLEGAGFAAYAVGGCVRDWLLGAAPHDYDICTAASPSEMQRVFAGERTIETGLKHGTLTVILRQMSIEITTFRQDGEYLDGRHPETVTFTRRVEDDLARRDFTINAMAYSPARGLADPFDGRGDCARGLIRCVGQPEKRFGEDALRILRALRFSARLGFPIEENTAAALRAGRGMLGRISRERIAAEMNGLLLGSHAGEILTAYAEVIDAALNGGGQIDWAAAAPAVDGVPLDGAVRWAALLAGAKGRHADILKALKMPNRLTNDVDALIAWGDALLTADKMQYALMKLGAENAKRLIALQAALDPRQAGETARALQARLDQLLREDACCTLGQLAVNGRDLAALGLRGPAIGQTLNRLLEGVTWGRWPNEKEALLKEAGQ
ncbi:MAG: tRNA nucleotidyltransferase [Clostridia bacterium]|nr:tRNA nucleotidyltransferase [Clostridia bacterium]